MERQSTYGYLTIISDPIRINNHTFVDCLCVCGSVKTYRLDTIKCGSTSSCGCKKYDLMAASKKNDLCTICHTPKTLENTRLLSNGKMDCYCKKCRLEYSRRHREKNASKIKEQSRLLWKKYYQEKHKNVQFRRYHDDTQFRLSRTCRHRISEAVKKSKTYKHNKTSILIGCTIDFLKSYLESQFTEGMTWDNYGEWHIDHIRPCASFDLTDPEQQKQCFHYTNLQPLWAIDNIRKSDKWEG